MLLIEGLKSTRLDKASALTIGVFDGVHRGHQHLLARVKTRAKERGLLAGVVALDPHPREILKPEVPFRYLSTWQERVRLFQEQGLDFVVLQPFSKEFSYTTAQEFVRMLRENLQMKIMVAGPDFALGHDRQGDLPTLTRMGEETGFEVEVLDPLELGGMPVRSTIIRSLVQKGKLQDAASLLGRPPSLSGKLVSQEEGLDRFRAEIWEKQVMPDMGMYSGQAQIESKAYSAIVKVIPPSHIQGEKPMVEISLTGYGGKARGQEIRLELMKELQAEVEMGEYGKDRC